MKNLSTKGSLVAAFVLPLLLASCGGGAAPEDDSPAAQAFHYREGLMTVIAWTVGRLRGMASGDIPVDEAEFTKGAHDLVTLAGMITAGFPPDSAVKGSSALPDIWMNWNDFQQKAADLQTAAQSLADTASQSGFEAAKGMVQPVGQACGGCHRPYRRREE